MITFDRERTPVKIFDGDKYVGIIIKTRAIFYLQLNLIRFGREGRITSYGSEYCPFKRLEQAKLKARQILSIIEVKPY